MVDPSLRTSIDLPGSNYVVQQWFVRNGSAVQAGDKVATAAIGTKSVVPSSSSSSSSSLKTNSMITAATAGDGVASSVAPVKHKRPTKRKRAVAATATASTFIEETNAAATAAATATTTTTTSNNKNKTDAEPSSSSCVKKLSTYLPKDDLVSIVAPCAGIMRVVPKPSSSTAACKIISNDSTSEMTDSSPLTIAYIEPCTHPTIMDGLCAVCGAKVGIQPTSKQSSGINSNNKDDLMSQVTVSGGVTMTISETEARQMSQQTWFRLVRERKLSLVLDLDHTLVHATADVRARNHFDARSDVRTLILPILTVTTEQVPQRQQQQQPAQYQWMQHYVKLRPHVDEFLREASQENYEVSVYTAGTRTYAEHVCMLLCRSMVGATCDEEELHRMRQAVMKAEHELRLVESKQGEVAKESTVSQEASNTDETCRLESNKDKESAKGEEEATTNGEIADDNASKGKKRKVSFGKPPESTKTDEMTPARLDELKQELSEAETKEQEALDVRQRVFGSRIVSRTDVGDLGRDVKSLERIFPGGGSMALIVDDREDVWANAQDNSKQQGEPPENLLLIRPYHWKPFLGFADVNNAAGEDISGESTTTEDEDDCALLWTLDILKRMHKRFFDAVQETGNDRYDSVTVLPLIREMRHEVLRGCTLVFSGLIPLHHQNRTSQFPRPAVVRYGESLGARVLDNVDDTVTHVVAARDGTDKIHRARRVPGCVIVKASWLMECVWTLTRRDVAPHFLGKATIPPPAEGSVASNSSSSDDEDLAAQLEADMMG